MTNKKLWLVPFSAVAIMLAVGSTAYACTAFKGYLTVRGNCTTTNCSTASGTVRVDGNGSSMSQTVDSGIARASKSNGTFTFATGRTTNNGGSQLKDGTYNVLYYNTTSDLLGTYPGYTGTGTSRQWETDCMSSGLLGNGTKRGTVQIDISGEVSGGSGTGFVAYNGSTKEATFSFGKTLNTNPDGSNESAVCVSDSGAVQGNQAPITIL